jgi:hypothetical protein
MALVAPNADMTDLDFDALRHRLITLIKSVFPDWSDFSVATFGNVLIEMYAFVGDVLTFYIDSQAHESRLGTATQRKNVIALARMLGYRLYGARAATAQVVFSLAAVAPAPVRIPAGTKVRTREVIEPTIFQLMSDLVIGVGERDAVATVEHSTNHVQRFDSRGLPNLDLLLDHTPFLDGSARVSAANGAYDERESLLDSGPNDRHFMVLVDQNDRATVRFGNGKSGASPTGTITIAYKTGGGAIGNVEAGRLVVLDGTFNDAHGRPTELTCTNPEPASGGTDRQSMASAKLLAPESLRTLTRTVTREDFEINARRVPGVARALMLTSNEDPTIAENSGILFIIPHGGGLPTPALKDLVRQQVTEVYPCTMTFQVAVQDPVYRPLTVAARVFLRQGHSAAAVRDRIQQNLAAMFRISEPDATPNPAVDFGFNRKTANGAAAAEVAWSDVYNTIRDTVGVRKLGDQHGDLTLNGLAADVPLAIHEFPVLGAVTLRNGDTGEALS